MSETISQQAEPVAAITPAQLVRGVSFAGRAPRMHILMVGQMLTAEASGSRDSSIKSNVGVWCLARYGVAGWRTTAGDIPMPPSPDRPGRLQCVQARGVSEVQSPLIDGVLLRKLAMSGTVTKCPPGMPGTAAVTGTRMVAGGPDQPEVTVTPAGPDPRRVTLAEAISLGIVHRRTTLGALKMARFRDKDFPADKGLRGTAKVYDPAELAAWDQARRS
jgi:hypothetical protein